MTGLDRTALALNAFAALSWLPAFASQEEGLLLLAVAASVFGLLLSSIAITTKGRHAETRTVQSPSAPVDELDPHTVLDLDARLDALERAQHDAVDAARWRALVESGQVTGLAAPASSSHAEMNRQSVPGATPLAAPRIGRHRPSVLV